MRSRLAVCVLGVGSLLSSANAQAQPAPGTIPPPRIYAPAPYDANNTWPAWGVPAYDDPGDPRMGLEPQYGPGPDRIITEQISGDRGGFYEDSPFDRFAAAVAKSSYIQLDYMHFDFEEPGRVLLGSQVAGVVDPSKAFSATIANLTGTARVPTTQGLDYNNAQGIRGLYGLETTAGSFEASIFSFDKNSDKVFESIPLAPVLNPAAQVQLATSTLTNGQLSQNLFLYDSSFQVSTSASFFGAEANWIAKSPYEDGFVLRPMVGFRYLDFHEVLNQRGVFDQQGQLVDQFGAPTQLVSTIDSDANNRVYAPQFGVRAEFVNPWFTLGIEPKVAFGVNTYDASVVTERLRSLGDPRTLTKEDGTRFTPVGDFSTYAKIRVRDNFSLRVGYQLIVASGVTRSASNIYYNDNGSANPPAVVVKSDTERMVWQGLTIGGEFRFR